MLRREKSGVRATALTRVTPSYMLYESYYKTMVLAPVRVIAEEYLTLFRRRREADGGARERPNKSNTSGQPLNSHDLSVLTIALKHITSAAGRCTAEASHSGSATCSLFFDGTGLRA